MTATTLRSGFRAIPSGVWELGFVSLFMDTSSEAIHALLPIYLVSNLGTSALTVGIIEGIAEATAAITKIFSGALSDWLGKRKFLAALGYGLAAITKPVFLLATSVGWLVAARFVDRIGKGIRDATRDARFRRRASSPANFGTRSAPPALSSAEPCSRFSRCSASLSSATVSERLASGSRRTS